MITLSRLPEGMVLPRLDGVRLCMIVKNEAKVIQRCLRSVLPHIDSWLIVDTGSTDDTPALIQQELGHLPGLLCHEPWVDFGYNRTEAFYLARRVSGEASYVMLIDADEVFTGHKLVPAQADVLFADFTLESRKFQRPFLIRASMPFWWHGAIHEELRCEIPTTTGTQGCIQCLTDGGRHSVPGWQMQDLRIMAEMVKQDPTDVRRVFHLAKLLQNNGFIDEAKRAFFVVVAQGTEPDAAYATQQLRLMRGEAS